MDGFETSGVAFEDQAEYLSYVEKALAHEMGEQFSDTQMQQHFGDELGEMWVQQAQELQEAAEAGLDRGQFSADYEISSAFQDGRNGTVCHGTARVWHPGGVGMAVV